LYAWKASSGELLGPITFGCHVYRGSYSMAFDSSARRAKANATISAKADTVPLANLSISASLLVKYVVIRPLRRVVLDES
jgi:hypothetical protein